MSDNSALRLLSGEPQGFAIDATTEGGSIAIRDTTTVANNHILSGVTDSIRNGLDSFNRTRAGSAKIVQSGTSPKFVHFAESPYLRCSPHNLVIRSEALDDAAWTKTDTTITANSIAAPNGTTTADLCTEGVAGTGKVNSTAITTISGDVLSCAWYLKRGNTDWLRAIFENAATGTAMRVWINLATGALGSTTPTGSDVVVTTATSTDAGNGWYRLAVSFTHVTTDIRIGINTSTADGGATRVNNGTYYAWGAQCNRGASITPYIPTTSAAVMGIPQSYDATEEQYGVLIEPAATNLSLRSEDLSHADWGETVMTVTANATTAPDGTSTADKVAEATTNVGEHIIYNTTATGLSGLVIAMSVYLKAAERTWVFIDVSDGSSHKSWFNLTSGATGTSESGNTSSITSVGNGWYRCAVSRTSAAANPYLVIGTSTGDNVSSITGVIGNGIYVWGAQTETGSVATSYIPTLGSTVTRATDLVNVALSSIPHSTSADTLGIEFKPPAANGYEVLYIGTASANTPHVTTFGGASKAAIFAGPNFNMSTDPTANASNIFKWAFATGNVRVSINGGTADFTDSFTIGNNTALYLGSPSGSADQIKGLFFKIVYVPRRVANSDLATWSLT